MSLHPIDGGKSGPKFTAEQKGKTGKYKFSWNPCTPFSLPPQDGCKDVLLCQSNGDFRYPAGETVASFAETKGTDSITITYIPMKKEGDKSLRQGVIKLECDPSKYPGNFTSKFEEKDEKDNLIKYRITTNQTATLNLMKKGIKRKPSAIGLNLTTSKISQYSLLKHLLCALLLMVVSRFHIYYRALT
ncbi:uncharacterized protein LOC141882630 isoform X5 [Acropora palmata]|uniref:uncharacterized protein LOC141882630 isoform X5 n=1 Tax=Acropora palmata TaxID=6131 RepID=UPI003DA153C9